MARRGEAHHCAKLTAPQVRAMRRLYWVRGIDCRCLSKFYGVTAATCFDIVNYITWKHVRDTFTAAEITRGK